MNEEAKSRIQQAVFNYLKKQDPKDPPRKNGRPEKQVEQEVLNWCRLRGWDVNVIEAKSTFSEQQGRYIAQAAAPGISDIVGNTRTGLAVFIELKATGKLSTIRANQREFLLRKINTGCFAVCVDSVSRIETLWNGFVSSSDKKLYLVEALPKFRSKEKELKFDVD